MNTNQMALDTKDVYPERFLIGSRDGKGSPGNPERPLFALESAGVGRTGHPSAKGKQQRDILHLQYKASAVRACPEQPSRIRALRVRAFQMNR